ncbi:MAG TPA: bifunctional phosphopantothenoylcysteine decarboxylase/phosphopantothenate--cysteine ligase CoaBC [Longimicrobiaceae bacterium]
MPARPRAARRPFVGRRVVLGVTGGIAAYKSIQLARDLTIAGAEVDVVITRGGLEFVQPLPFEALTGRPVRTLSHAPGEAVTHIRLAREASLVVVAPATANFLARAAAGMADDLLTSILLATEAPVLLVPAMNDRMYAHAQMQRNLQRLGELGYTLIEPALGPLAWGEGEGRGRMPEPEEIFEHCARALEPPNPLSGRRVLVTAGPTREPLDPVRFLGNRSSGRMGYALARAAWRRGAEVTLISGPTALEPPTGVRLVRVESATEMRDAVAEELPSADALIMAAAVADFRPARAVPQKIKKGEAPPEIPLEANDDILLVTRNRRRLGSVVVGFALETESAVENGREKLQKKGLDLLVVNDATEPGAGFEVDTNRVVILDRDGNEADLPLLSKDEVADEILDRVAAYLERATP